MTLLLVYLYIYYLIFCLW